MLDFLRHHIKQIRKIYSFFFDRVTRKIEKEKNFLTGASYYLLGCSLVIIFFENQSIIISSLLIMTISDSCAAIIGIKYGKTKLHKNKTLEGSVSFFISAFIILVLFISELDFYILFLIAFIITIIELFSSHQINDNIAIPISAAILIQLFI